MKLLSLDFRKKFLETKLWKYSSITALSWGISNCLNVVIALYLIRNLSLSDYGVYSGLFAVTALLSIVVPGLQLYFTKLGIYLKHGYSKIIIYTIYLKYSFSIIGLFIILQWLVTTYSLNASHYFSQFLGYQWFILGLSFIALIQSMADGLLRGLQRFGLLAFLSVISVILKGLGMLFVLFFKFSLENILLAILTSASLIFIIEVLVLLKYSVKEIKATHAIETLDLPNIIPLTLTTLLLGNFTNVELILARNFLSPQLTGIYAAQANLARIVLIGNSILIPIIYTLMSEDMILQKSSNQRLQWKLYIPLLAGSIFFIIMLLLFHDPLFALFFHKPLPEILNVSWILATGYGLFSITDVLIHQMLARNQTHIFTLLLAVNIFEIWLLNYHHATIWDFAVVSVTTQVVLFVGGMSFFYTSSVKRKTTLKSLLSQIPTI